jgi:hypothetical protein
VTPKDDFVNEFRGVILLENFNQAKMTAMNHLEQRLKYKNKLEAQLEATIEKAMDNTNYDKEISRLRWQITNETSGIMAVVELIEASETALEVFRDKMLETLEMDVKKMEELRAVKSHYEFTRTAWLSSMNDVIVATEQRNELLFKIHGI